MNSRLLHCLYELAGLYAPQSFQGTSEHVACPNMIGVGRVATANARKMLSLSVVTIAPSTLGARLRSVRGRNGVKLHTVLFGLMSNPRKNSAIGPRCDCFSKCLTSFLLFATLHVMQLLDSKRCQRTPRQKIDGPVNVVLAFAKGSLPRLRARLTATNLVSNGDKLAAIVVAVRVGNQLIQAKVQSQCDAACLGCFSGCVDPHDQSIFTQGTTLNEFRSGDV